MHAGDQVEDLEPFTIYDASAVEDQSRGLALAYGLGYMIRTERSASPIAGTSSAAAAEAGVASITAEAGGRGLVDEASVRLHEEGVRRVLAMLGVLPATFEPAPAPIEISHWLWLRSTNGGWWSSNVRVGEAVRAGSVLGTTFSDDESRGRGGRTPSRARCSLKFCSMKSSFPSNSEFATVVA
jgi:predicted deacylase